mmetsp:Transcript_2829/g.6710  ORF Transcript_2829/g.6710 Transcript_2829/m.6710 type:complete len:422 (-) Transcript_2829:182-1447(-)
MEGKKEMARGREKEKQCMDTHGICLHSQLWHRTHREGQANLGETASQLQLPTRVSDRVYISREAQAPAYRSEVVLGDGRAAERSQADNSVEVARILEALMSWEVLGVAVHSPKAICRQAYLRRSLMVHPDKCKHPRAGEAFRRLADAYKHLSEGGPWRDGSAAASSQRQSTHSSSSHDQHQRGHPFHQPHGNGDNRGGHSPGGDPFAFFREAAEQAFQSGEFSRDDFSDLFGQPAAIGGTLVGAVLVGSLGCVLGGALGSVVGDSVALESASACQCHRARREGGRCELCRGRVSLGSSLGGAAGGTAGLAFGAAAGAAIGAKLGSAIASAFAAGRDQDHGGGHASARAAEGARMCPVTCPDGGHPDWVQSMVGGQFMNCGHCGHRQRLGAVIWECTSCSFVMCHTCREECNRQFERDCKQQ